MPFEYLRGASGPFFAWYHYKFVHLPYWPAAAHRVALGLSDADLPPRMRDTVAREFVLPRAQHRIDPGDTEVIRRLYAAGVHQADAWLGRVFAELARRDLLESTTVVITSDHGEELMERGHVGHASTAEHALLTEELLRIPLLVVDRRIARPVRLSERVEGVDLFPTLLALAGLPAPPSQGLDIAGLALNPVGAPGPAPNRPFLFQSARMGYRTPESHAAHLLRGLSDGREKVVVETCDGERAWRCDLVADPGETSPVIAGPELEAAVARLEAAFRALR